MQTIKAVLDCCIMTGKDGSMRFVDLMNDITGSSVQIEPSKGIHVSLCLLNSPILSTTGKSTMIQRSKRQTTRRTTCI